MTTRVWWVNQRRNDFAEETSRGIIWAPMKSEGGREFAHWTRMSDLRAGDVVLHYHDGLVEAISNVRGPAVTAPHPTADPRWAETGRLVNLETSPLPVSVRKKDIPLWLRLECTSPSEPFTKKGDVKQGYLFHVPPRLATDIAVRAGLDAPASGDDPEGWDLTARDPGGGPKEPLLIANTEDGVRVGVFRPEQRQLAGFLFRGRPTVPCAFCGRDLPRRYLVTAHIKPRARATPTERADHNIVVAACTLGCDSLFEHGAIVVDEDGLIRPGTAPATTALGSAVEALVGRRVDPFGTANARYFAWHRRWFHTS